MFQVTKENNDVFIQGIAPLQWGKWKDSTYGGTVTAILNCMGIDATYDMVMGLSGDCFKFCVDENFDPAALIAQIGPLSEKTLGEYYGIDVYSIADAEARDKNVMENIEKGIPVLLCGGRRLPEWSLVTGYTMKDGKPLFFGRSYVDVFFKCKKVDPSEEYTSEKYPLLNRYPGDFPSDLLRFYDKRCTPISLKDAMKASLETCIGTNEQPVIKEGPFTYRFGQEAYDLIINGLESEKEPACLLGDRPDNSQDWPKGEHCIGSLIDRRTSAYKFLESVSKELDAESSPAIEKLAGIYKNIVSVVTQAIPYEHTTAVLGGGSRPAYSRDMRLRIAAALKEAKTLELEAVSLAKEILKAWS